MSEEIEREIESTRPDERENPALRVPAIRRARDRSPHARDPTPTIRVFMRRPGVDTVSSIADTMRVLVSAILGIRNT